MLNNTKINRLKPGDKTYRELDSDGLYIEVKPNGRKFWRFRYRKADGKWTMTSLGEYPETTIQAAREARDARQAQGRYIARTFSEIAREWHDKKRYRSEKRNYVAVAHFWLIYRNRYDYYDYWNQISNAYQSVSILLKHSQSLANFIALPLKSAVQNQE